MPEYRYAKGGIAESVQFISQELKNMRMNIQKTTKMDRTNVFRSGLQYLKKKLHEEADEEQIKK